MNWQCRWSPTLGELEDTHQNIWGTKDYENDTDPTVFFGLYGLPDFYALWRHKGERHILWAGTDIIHFMTGYWLEDGGGIRLQPQALAEWINKHCTNWCENEEERRMLANIGIEAIIQPSFLGDMDKYKPSYQARPFPKLYCSVSGNNFQQYGWDKIPDLALANPNVEFHLYGNTEPFKYWKNGNLGNIVFHGRIPKEQMNAEIKEMQGALRLTEFDGFSEILAKSILWAQWPVSLIPYPHMLSVNEIDKLKDLRQPNLEGREYYLNQLNQYPWAKKNTK